MKISKIVLIPVLSFLVIGGVWFENTFMNNIYYSDANYITDFRDDRRVVGSSDNVFIAKIEENMGAFPDPDLEYTEFKVEVLYNIKGKTKKNITVVQMGGYDELNNLHIPVGTSLMEEGNIYLLATLGENHNILSHENGSHLISSEKDISNSDLKKLLKEDKVLKERKKSYKNEVISEEFEPGRFHTFSTGKNLYKDLSKKEKGDFEDIKTGFVE